MQKLRKKIGRKLRYDQKKDWDKIAYSYLKSHNPIFDVILAMFDIDYNKVEHRIRKPKVGSHVDLSPREIKEIRGRLERLGYL